MVVHMRVTDASAGRPPRVGFVVSKAVGNAVVRARTKRRLRALMSARVDRLPQGADLVVRANPAAARADSAELGRALDPLLDKVLRAVPQAQTPGEPADAASRA